jgi:hypothetical protein
MTGIFAFVMGITIIGTTSLASAEEDYEPDLLAGIFHEELTFSPASATSINNGSLTTNYVILPQINFANMGTIENTLPLYEYTVRNDSFTFWSGIEGSYVDLIDSAIAPHNMPKYDIGTVKVNPSFAWASAADESAGADKTAVWGNVIGIVAGGSETSLGWQLLTEERTWPVGSGYTGFKTIYSQMDPADDTAVDAYGNTVGEAGYWVGMGFKPGNITFDVTFARFSPKEDQPEVTNIRNEVDVTAIHGYGADAKVLNSVKAGVNIGFDAAGPPVDPPGGDDGGTASPGDSESGTTPPGSPGTGTVSPEDRVSGKGQSGENDSGKPPVVHRRGGYGGTTPGNDGGVSVSQGSPETGTVLPEVDVNMPTVDDFTAEKSPPHPARAVIEPVDDGSWSLLSLLLPLIAFMTALGLILLIYFLVCKRKKDDDGDEDAARS